MRAPARPEHVIWDWNGTLFDDGSLCAELMSEILAEHGLPTLDHESYRRKFAFPIEDYYRELGFDLERHSFEKLGAAFMERYEAEKYRCFLQPHARETLAALKETGIPQSVLSAYPQETLDEVLGRYGLKHFFDSVKGHHTIYARSKVESGRSLLMAIQSAPSDILLIGDTLHDREVALALGMRHVLVCNGHNCRERIEAESHLLLESLQEIGAIWIPAWRERERRA